MNRIPRTRATHVLPRLSVTLALVAALGLGGPARAAPAADAATLAELQRQLAQVQAALQQLSDENRALREHEKQIDQQLAQLHAAAPGGRLRAGAGRGTRPRRDCGSTAGECVRVAGGWHAGEHLTRLAARGLRLWGYGEVYYTNPVHDSSQTQADLARAVFGIGYRF